MPAFGNWLTANVWPVSLYDAHAVGFPYTRKRTCRSRAVCATHGCQLKTQGQPARQPRHAPSVLVTAAAGRHTANRRSPRQHRFLNFMGWEFRRGSTGRWSRFSQVTAVRCCLGLHSHQGPAQGSSEPGRTAPPVRAQGHILLVTSQAKPQRFKERGRGHPPGGRRVKDTSSNTQDRSVPIFGKHVSPTHTPRLQRTQALSSSTTSISTETGAAPRDKHL